MITAEILDYILCSISDLFLLMQDILFLEPYPPYFPYGLSLFDVSVAMFVSFFIANLSGFESYEEFVYDTADS